MLYNSFKKDALRTREKQKEVLNEITEFQSVLCEIIEENAEGDDFEQSIGD